jgi:NTP pyrophosphatase (non-canonical NTP hydrolase)
MSNDAEGKNMNRICVPLGEVFLGPDALQAQKKTVWFGTLEQIFDANAPLELDQGDICATWYDSLDAMKQRGDRLERELATKYAEIARLHEALKEAARTSTDLANALSYVRPEVYEFSRWMEARLRDHDQARGKTGWLGEDWTWLHGRMLEEAEELWQAPEHKVASEAADVANFAMMIADVSGNLMKHEPDGTVFSVQQEALDAYRGWKPRTLTPLHSVQPGTNPGGKDVPTSRSDSASTP